MSGRTAAAIVLAAMLAGAALAVEAARSDSVTIDEFAHLPAGLVYLRTGRFNIYNLSPPLLRVWCALPVWWMGADAAFEQFGREPNHWQLGYDFMQRNAERYQALFVAARLQTIVLLMALIATTALTAWRIYGATAGVLAAVLTAFCPNLLAHGHLVTTDLGHTLAIVAAVVAYEAALRRMTMGRTLGAGLALGLAQLTKFSALMLYPLLLVMTLVALVRHRSRWHCWSTAAIAAALSLLVINAGYLFAGTGRALRSYEFDAGQMQRLAGGPLGRVPVPLPEDYVAGYDRQLAEAQGQYTVYFHGALSRHGWWYYYPAAFVLKTPVPFLLLFAVGAAMWLFDRRLRHDWLRVVTFVGAPLAYGVSLALWTDMNLGVRYVLPVYPFMSVIAASVCAAQWSRRRAMQVVVAVVLAAQVASTLWARPFYIAYFNLLVGSANGYRWLIDSNVDWGQELLRLRAFLQAEHIEQVRLAYFGRVAPEIYGIDYAAIPARPTPGVYVLSASYLMGKPYYLYDHGTLYWVPANVYSAFQALNPTAVIGHSLFIYDLRGGVPPALRDLDAQSAAGSAPSS